MKKTAKLLILSLFLSCAGMINAQSSLTIDASQLYTSFKFDNSLGTRLNRDYEGILTSGYSVGYKYEFDFGLILNPKVGMRNGGAALVYDDMHYSWDLKYTNFNLGVGYKYKLGRFSPYFMASGYYAILIEGVQTLNNENFNLLESELLNKSDYGIIFAPGVELVLSDFISSHLEFNYLWGLKNLEVDAGQNAGNYAYGLTLGLSFAITK